MPDFKLRCLIIIAGAAMYSRAYGASVVTEWIIGFVFTFYVLSIAIDFFTTPDLREDVDQKKLLVQQ